MIKNIYIAFGAMVVVAGVFFSNQFMANDPQALEKQKINLVRQALINDKTLMKEIGELRFGDGQNAPQPLIKEMEQMEALLNGNAGGEIPDLKNLIALAKKADRVEKALIKIVGKPADYRQTRFGSVKKTAWDSDLESMEKFDKMTNSRNLVVQLVFPEEVFGPNIDKNNSKSIAKELADFECELALKSFAEKCQFARYRFASIEMEDGKAVVQFSLRMKFIQKDGIGNVAKDTNLKIKVHQKKMIADEIVYYDLLDTKRMAAQRLKTYQNISERCRELRSRFGNCGVTWVIFGANIRSMRTDTIYVNSEAKFGVLNSEI